MFKTRILQRRSSPTSSKDSKNWVETTTPYSFDTPRRVPIPLMKAVKSELDRMEKQGVIAKVTKPTEWCSGMVVVPKKGGRVRTCVDL